MAGGILSGLGNLAHEGAELAGKAFNAASTAASNAAKSVFSAVKKAGSAVMGCFSKKQPPLSGIVKEVNPTKSVVNCGNIVDAVVARLDGSNPTAVSPATQDGSFDDIAARHGTAFQWGHNFNDAFQQVRDGGDGTVALVGIQYAGGASSHIVTMANQGGVVGIAEAQDWGPGLPQEVITDPARANARYGADSDIGIALLPHH